MCDANEKDREYWGLKTYTSKTWTDLEFDDDGTFKWDCCNIDYCKKHRKQSMKKRKFTCLRGGGSSIESRCPQEEKHRIRLEADVKSFKFPHDLT